MTPSRTRPKKLPPSEIRRRSAGRGGGGRRAAALGALVAAVVVLGAVLVFTGRDGDGATADSAPVELAHVHGLGVDPASGDLYAGSHYGLFRVPEQGEPALVGGLVQDFMGFTVVGPDHFLASGHPGQDQDGPANLGLIESTDGGRSWQSLSLAGEADFHALEAKHGQVYGYNAGQLMVSPDTRTWDTRASIALADLTVSPQDPQTLLATTRDGLARSTDGGRSFRLTQGAPLLALVTWPDAERVVGVAPDGTVHISEDGGANWEQRGSAGGAPEALTASEENIYVAIEGRIVESADGGRTFRTRYATL